MLSKLIGYEFKATRRIFLPAYGVLIVLALLNAVFVALPQDMLSQVETPFAILIIVYVLAMFAVCVLSFAYMISRFYKNLLGDEGYLMFTLPASPSQLIWSKCITSTIWMTVTVVLCVISLILMVTPLVAVELATDPQTTLSYMWSAISGVMSDLVNTSGVNLFFVSIELIALFIVSTMNFCMHIYACLSVGALAGKHRLGFAFLTYLGFDAVKQTALTIAAYIADAFTLIFDFDLNLANLSTSATLHIVLIVYLIILIVCLVVNFLISNRILSKHLNLQ